MSRSRRETEPHNGARIDDLGGGRYLTIPHREPFAAITINSVSIKSGAVQGTLPGGPGYRRAIRLGIGDHDPGNG